MTTTRRDFLKRSAAAGATASLPFLWTSSSGRAQQPDGRPTLAAIGVGGSRGAYSQGRAIALQASRMARMIAVCEVDDVHAAEFNQRFDGQLKTYRDYRELLEKEKPNVVTIGTPDHWHVPIAVAALRAGCDVYCEKPLTLTIEEGFRIRDAVKETGRVFQVGTQQRTDHNQLFLRAIAIVQSGRLGKNVKAHIAIGRGPTGGPFTASPPPADIDWDMFLGPAQAADFFPERKKDFRWYYDYSGGQMTDWGAHHIDIAQWALGHANSGPVKISGAGKFPPLVPEKFNWAAYFAGDAPLPNGFHTAPEFDFNFEYADGSLITIHNNYDAGDGRTRFDNGILFQGDDGRIFVNRGRVSGAPAENLTEAETKEINDRIVALYGGTEPRGHVRNFFDCVASRKTPISDVATHHRSMTCLHLANISLMLGRELRWDPVKEQFIGDDQATALMSRPRRETYSWGKTT